MKCLKTKLIFRSRLWSNKYFNGKEVLSKLSLVTTEKDDEGIEYGLRIHRSFQKEALNYLELRYENENGKILNDSIEKINIIVENKQKTKKWNQKKYYVNIKNIIDNYLRNENCDLNQKKN
jgi:hypothetical protein